MYYVIQAFDSQTGWNEIGRKPELEEAKKLADSIAGEPLIFGPPSIGMQGDSILSEPDANGIPYQIVMIP